MEDQHPLWSGRGENVDIEYTADGNSLDMAKLAKLGMVGHPNGMA